MRLVLITDRRLMGPTFGEAIARAVRGMPPRSVIVQVREKDLGGAALLALVREAMAAAPEQLVVVNDRLDVALTAGADGVHLPEDGLDLPTARALVRLSMIVGCSRHSIEGAVAAARAGADLVQLGPIYATPSKAAYGAPLGLDVLRAARAALPASTLLTAVGGIDSPARAAEVREAGADLAAVLRAAWSDASDVSDITAFTAQSSSASSH